MGDRGGREGGLCPHSAVVLESLILVSIVLLMQLSVDNVYIYISLKRIAVAR